jgi:hypothetical protein
MNKVTLFSLTGLAIAIAVLYATQPGYSPVAAGLIQLSLVYIPGPVLRGGMGGIKEVSL